MNKLKVQQFLDKSFPPYRTCTIVKEGHDTMTAVLDYGRNDRVRVVVGIDAENTSLYKLLQTDFI